MMRRWRYLAWFDVKRSRLWQGVFIAGVALSVLFVIAVANAL